MALMANGKKVIGYAMGGTEFYSIAENADGSISFNGEFYFLFNKTSNSFQCTWSAGTPNSVSVDPSQSLSSDSDLTLKDLINKGKKIRLTVMFHNSAGNYDSSVVSGVIDLSKPDSNGHFNFQWLKGATSTNTYCSFNSNANKFSTYSDAFSAYSSTDYDTGHMTIIYSDES